MRIITLPIQSQGIITRDNVSVDISAVAYFRIVDAVKSVVAIENVYTAIDQIAQTTLRKVVGRHTLDEILAETDVINSGIREILDVTTTEWGVDVTLVELKDIQLPESMNRAMARQAEAEREKRAKIIAAEGESLAAAELGDASDTMMAHPLALQLRNLQTLVELGVDKNSTVVFPAPLMSTISELGAFLARETESAKRTIATPTAGRVALDGQLLGGADLLVPPCFNLDRNPAQQDRTKNVEYQGPPSIHPESTQFLAPPDRRKPGDPAWSGDRTVQVADRTQQIRDSDDGCGETVRTAAARGHLASDRGHNKKVQAHPGQGSTQFQAAHDRQGQGHCGPSNSQAHDDVEGSDEKVVCQGVGVPAHDVRTQKFRAPGFLVGTAVARHKEDRDKRQSEGKRHPNLQHQNSTQSIRRIGSSRQRGHRRRVRDGGIRLAICRRGKGCALGFIHGGNHAHEHHHPHQKAQPVAPGQEKNHVT
ncbi:slipin family protein [Arthrobacter alpinus]|uniref:slipin family protein n=1 Tax=Arthrobacter alpinus TaxID=656366 RepID=UPI001ED99139|nr:slipin family protein [Arthrobacter alpinus]